MPDTAPEADGVVHGRVPLTQPGMTVSTWHAALAGLVAAAVALGTGELLASIGDYGRSLVITVDSLVIETTPGDATRAGIELFGTADKPILVTGTVILALLFGAALGVASRTHRWVGPVGFAGFAFLGAWAATVDELAPPGQSALIAAVAGVAGAATLSGLLAVAEGRRGRGTSQLLVTDNGRAGDERPSSTTGGQRPTDPVVGAAEMPTDKVATRRAFFGWAGAAGAAALATTGIGWAIRGRSRAEVVRAEVVLPEPTRFARDVAGGLEREVPGLSPLITANEDFYRIDTALLAPEIDPDRWELSVTGLVDTPYAIGFEELLGMATTEHDVTLSCVSNEVGGDLVGTARWQGVPLAELLERAGVRGTAEQVVGRSVDGWTSGFPIGAVRDGRPALVAVAMNGVALPLEHGFPARLVVGGLYGYVSATKWLTEIELTGWDDFDAYWVPRGWSKEGPMKTQSRVDVPRDGRHLRVGRQPVAGVAWAGTRGITKVEVQVDDDPWMDARLGTELAGSTWRQWVLEWSATPGEHRIRVRASDGEGEVQTSEETDPAPSGATGWHTIHVTVEA